MKNISTALSAQPVPNKATPLPISPDEELARFLTQSGHYNSRRIKQSAFLPAKNLETSVFRKTRLGVEYNNTKKKIEASRGTKIKAVAIIKACAVDSCKGLSVVPEESKHKWHANIIGWPAKKHEQKQLALLLAEQAVKE